MCISAGPLHEPVGAKGVENDRSPNLTVASSQRTLRTRKAVGICIIMYVCMCASIVKASIIVIHAGPPQHTKSIHERVCKLLQRMTSLLALSLRPLLPLTLV